MKPRKSAIQLPIFDGSRDSCRKIFDAIGDPVFITAIEDGKIIEINQATLGYLKCTREEVLGKNFVELGWWPNAEARRKFVESIDSSGKITKKEIIFNKDGKEFFFVLSARFIVFQDEPAIFIHLKDVTEEKRKAQALEESEARLKEAEMIAKVGHWKLVPQKQEFLWSDETYRLLDYEPEQVIPSRKAFLDRVHPEDRKRISTAFDEAVKKKQGSYEQVFRILTRNGQTRFLREKGRLVFEKDNLIEAIGIIQDVTSEYESNLRLHQSEKRWRDTFNAIDVSLMLLDADQTILLANDAATKLLGKSISEIQGRKCYELIHSDKRPPENCPFLITCNTRKSARKEISSPEFDRDFLVVTSPVFDQSGKIDYVVHLAHDVTMLKKTEAMLRHAQKMEALGTLAGGIAHDFNNILTGTMGFQELALMPETDPEKARMYISTSLKLSKRASELVKQILTFSRQEEKPKNRVILNELIKEIARMIRASIPPGIDIGLELPRSQVTIFASSADMQQVIMNLCTNAYQAMKETGGKLTIKLEILHGLPPDFSAKQETKSEYWAHLQVADTGCGIPSDIMDRIFEPYFTTKEPGEGTGLGLALVHGIVKQYEGHLSVESTPGKGSAFHVYLPVANENHSTLREEKEAGISKGKGKIMVVDDEQAIISLLKYFLEDIGYEVTAYTDPLDALKAFRNGLHNRVNVLVTDLAMPKMSGTELVKEIRKIRPELPVIMMTGLLDNKGRSAVDACKPDMLVTKPVSLESLSRSINRLVSARPG